jgi:arylsulfatase A-like enzyme
MKLKNPRKSPRSFLRERIYDHTAIIVTADHGVALPRGKQFLYDEGLHIPLIIRWPGGVKPGTSSAELVSNVDLVPTMLGIAGLPAPKYLQGRNILDPASPMSVAVKRYGLQAIAEISRPALPSVSVETTVPCIPGNPKPSSSCSKG